MPFTSRPAASGGLLFREYDGAFRLACMSQFQRYSIRRIRLEKMIDVFPEKASLQPLLQHVRSQDIGDLLQEVPGARLALYFHAQLAQPLHPLPYHGPRDANLFRDARAASGARIA